MIDSVGSARHCRNLAAAYTGFLTLGRLPAFPSRIHVQTQSRCNAACAMCPYPYANGDWVHGMMSRELYRKITDELADAPRGTTLTFSLQNEPLLNRDTFEWFRQAKESAPQVRRVLTTNGSLLHHFSPADIEAAELHILAVSLNANTRATYDELNCGLDFDAVVGNILRLAQIPVLRRVIRIDFVETEVNTREIDAARAFWSDRGIPMYVKPLHNRAGVLESYESLALRVKKAPRSRTAAVVRRLRNRLGCPQPFSEMGILHNGDVIICCHDWLHSCVLGNVGETSVRAVWNSEEMHAVRRSLVSGRAQDIAACAECSLA
jgi:radical SAM protein with 4Fe4S-binding SPASM domain